MLLLLQARSAGIVVLRIGRCHRSRAVVRPASLQSTGQSRGASARSGVHRHQQLGEQLTGGPRRLVQPRVHARSHIVIMNIIGLEILLAVVQMLRPVLEQARNDIDQRVGARGQRSVKDCIVEKGE